MPAKDREVSVMQRTLSPAGHVLVTGATGLIGGEILRRLGPAIPAGTAWALIRPGQEKTPEERLRQRLARSGDLGPIPASVRAVAGDVLQPGWGLSDRVVDDVRRRVEIIIHNAADTSFAAEDDPGRTNIEGVRQLIELARSCDRPPLVVYMSTASNVGDVRGRCVGEDEGCQPENRHHNAYTKSKAVAEALLRESGLPVLVLRPTIVLGAGLPDPQFARQILWVAPLSRLFEALPLDPSARVDVVDVGFVAEATLRLLAHPGRRHDCYHLSAGPDRSIRLADAIAIVSGHYGRSSTMRLIPPEQWDRSVHRRYVRTRMQRDLFRSIRYYLPFLNMDVVFDEARLRAELGPDAPEPRPLGDYLGGLLALIRTASAVREAALP